jgi:uncharacterized protein YndB with AHSA1/START domain
MVKIDGVTRGTGRSRAEWFTVLDRWGAPGRPYKEIAEWLTGTHGLSKWWAQKLIVEYEQARGVREPNVRRDGTFEVGASKTVAVPVEALYAAFVDGRRRTRWLPEAPLELIERRAHARARFNWDGGATRVTATFTAKGPGKATVVVTHDRLPDARAAATTKAVWREGLAALKSALES